MCRKRDEVRGTVSQVASQCTASQPTGSPFGSPLLLHSAVPLPSLTYGSLNSSWEMYLNRNYHGRGAQSARLARITWTTRTAWVARPTRIAPVAQCIPSGPNIRDTRRTLTILSAAGQCWGNIEKILGGQYKLFRNKIFIFSRWENLKN